MLRPQQNPCGLPLTSAMAQVCCAPALMAVTPVKASGVVAVVAAWVEVFTSTGTSDRVVVLLPNWPEVLRPQHFAAPVVSTAQAKPVPTLTEVALTVVPLMPETGTA